jgi:predicted GNAT family acetyltransferase
MSTSPTPGDADVTVTDDPAEHRFEIRVGDELAGFTVYEPGRAEYAFVHTEIDRRFSGRGLGSTLIGAALDVMRKRRLGVLPYCPFVRAFIDDHREYLDLVPEARRAAFHLGTQRRSGADG